MIHLINLYGNKIFNRKKAYKNSRYAPILETIIYDLIFTFLFIEAFEVNWEYAFFKVWMILSVFSILKYAISSPVEFLTFNIFMKNCVISDMKHHLKLFKSKVNWDEIATYDQFLFDAAFNNSLSDDSKVLAAMNWGVITGLFQANSRFEDRCYWLFQKVAPDYYN